MNIPATPPGSDGPLDRLAELAEGLLQRLEEGGGGVGEVLFVVVVMHYLLRFAALYVRVKAGLLAPGRTGAAKGSPAPARDRSDPEAPPLRASQFQASGAARGVARALRPHSPLDQYAGRPTGGAAQVPDAVARWVMLSPRGAPGHGIPAGRRRADPARPAHTRPSAPELAPAIFDGSARCSVRMSIMFRYRNVMRTEWWESCVLLSSGGAEVVG